MAGQLRKASRQKATPGNFLDSRLTSPSDFRSAFSSYKTPPPPIDIKVVGGKTGTGVQFLSTRYKSN